MSAQAAAGRAVTLTDIVEKDGVFVDGDWVESKDQDPEGNVRLVQLADVGDGKYRDRSSRYLTDEKAEDLRCTFLERGDLLVARMPDPLGRACIFPGDAKRAVTVVDVAVVRPRNPQVNDRWLMYQLNAPTFRRAVAALQSGSTRQRISRKNLASISFHLPERRAQDEAVAEIEKQFSRLDQAVTNLQRVMANLKRYRNAVLASALSGDLCNSRSEGIGAAGNDFGQHVESPEMAPDVSLPSTWSWARADEICAVIASGSTPKPDDMTAAAGDVPFIKVYNLTLDGPLDFTIKPTFIAAATHNGLLARSRCKPGDVLMNIVGPPLGKISIVPNDFPEWNINQAVVTFRVNERVLNRLLAYWLMSPAVRKRIERTSKATAGQFNVQVSTCRRLVLPLPPLAEQHRIVAQIDRRLSIVSEVESEVEANLRRATRMRHAILETLISCS